MKCPDHYAVLGVSDTATEKEIRAAYRALAFQHHPDVSSEQGASTRARFQRIQDAYHVLRHKERRATYDHRRKWNSLVSHAEGQQSWTRPTAGQPDKNDPFAEGFDKWFRDAGCVAEACLVVGVSRKGRDVPAAQLNAAVRRLAAFTGAPGAARRRSGSRRRGCGRRWPLLGRWTRRMRRESRWVEERGLLESEFVH